MTFAFADRAAELYGLARLGLAGGQGSALALLFAGREPVAALARGGLEAADGFERLALGGVSATVEEPLRRWTVALGGDDGFELAFEALAPPAELGSDEPAAEAGGMVGYEQLCRVAGTVRVGGRARDVRCAGQRGHTWGEPDWDRIGSARTLTAWLDDGTGLALSSIRPAGAQDHSTDATWAALLAPAGTLRVDEPRLSTGYDEEGRQVRAGLELWVGDDDAYPRRANGEALCGAELDLGRLRLGCAFFRWRMDGRPGVGRYDILRRR